MPLLELRESGLYCAHGGFYVDPWAPVDRAVITHAHPEHAIPGCQAYLTATAGEELLRERVGPDAVIQTAGYGESLTLGEVQVSLHPAGHILGSAQVQVEHRGEVWVVSGDYKLEPDPTCAPFEPLRCHTFLTEATFGLPIFRWPSNPIDSIHDWWRANQQVGKASLLFAHELGMSQRVLASIDSSIGPIHAHPEIDRFNQIYRQRGIALAPTATTADLPRALILAPPSSHGSPWAKSLGAASTALASGWMRIRGTRRRRSLDRGFVLSDHADWPALLRAIEETGAETVLATHGHRVPLARWVWEHGRRAGALETRFDEAQT
ncbi:MAG TPA: ligase-associated DNA damage response exonuclease [Bryobacteraceae bacterium]|nr:ligase-associated DNA damage response exonuclease [Bryobacteraceae bacterium]